MPEPTKPTLDQKRAAYAWNQAVAHQASGKPYLSMTKSAPAFIMSNGLMQAVAFYQSRNKNDAAAGAIVDGILGWLGKQMPSQIPAPAFSAAMNALHTMPSQDYMRATRETLAMLRWLRQFADALAKDAPASSGGGNK